MWSIDESSLRGPPPSNLIPLDDISMQIFPLCRWLVGNESELDGFQRTLSPSFPRFYSAELTWLVLTTAAEGRDIEDETK